MMSQNNNERAQLLSALEWHVLHGADDLWAEAPIDRTAIKSMTAAVKDFVQSVPQAAPKDASAPLSKISYQLQESATQSDIMGANEAIQAAQTLASACNSLEELKQAIADFDGLSIRQTASNIVFSDGNVQADVMVIGEAPESQDDISGRAFQDAGGQLLDKILACINLDRQAEDPKNAVYLTNALNWRPPGNRTPTNAEMDISLPFLTRHIELKQPKAIICLGGNVAQALLKKAAPISKLRGKIYDYAVDDKATMKLMVTYQPTYLLKTPAQKKAVWMDMLMFQDMLENL